MRLGRRLSTGTAEHPSAPSEATAPAAPAAPAVPDTVTAPVGAEEPGPRHEYAEHTADR